jgi:putative FmdB family regulatory protein
MPIYEYECKSCSLKFELMRRFGESSGANCPQCQGDSCRLFSPVPIFFKGPGFYVTDSAAESRVRLRNRRDRDRPAEADKASDSPRENKGEAMS